MIVRSLGHAAAVSRGYTFLGRGEGARSDFQCHGRRSRRERRLREGGGQQAEGAHAHRTGFHTVCGVTVDGKPYRHKCTVEGAGPGGPGETTLHFPDNAGIVYLVTRWLVRREPSR
jgi:hypothetical protein